MSPFLGSLALPQLLTTRASALSRRRCAHSYASAVMSAVTPKAGNLSAGFTATVAAAHLLRRAGLRRSARRQVIIRILSAHRSLDRFDNVYFEKRDEGTAQVVCLISFPVARPAETVLTCRRKQSGRVTDGGQQGFYHRHGKPVGQNVIIHDADEI